MVLLDDILDAYPDETFLIADGLDDAVIGVDEASMKLIYSVSECIRLLMLNSEMTHEEATEYFYYNTLRANEYNGDRAPIFCNDDI